MTKAMAVANFLADKGFIKLAWSEPDAWGNRHATGNDGTKYRLHPQSRVVNFQKQHVFPATEYSRSSSTWWTVLGKTYNVTSMYPRVVERYPEYSITLLHDAVNGVK